MDVKMTNVMQGGKLPLVPGGGGAHRFCDRSGGDVVQNEDGMHVERIARAELAPHVSHGENLTKSVFPPPPTDLPVSMDPTYVAPQTPPDYLDGAQ